MQEAPITWRDDVSEECWDAALAHLGGHPRQSALWERVRVEIDGAQSKRHLASRDGRPVCMIRAEVHQHPQLGRALWVPRGPTPALPLGAWWPSLRDRVSAEGVEVVVTDSWAETGADCGQALWQQPSATVWLDLRIGREHLWDALAKQWRYGIRHAARRRVRVEETRQPSDIERFCALCREIAMTKQFSFPWSPNALRLLLEHRSENTECALLAAWAGGAMAAGAFIFKLGQSAHYFWGGTDRAYAQYSPGEAVQWAAIEWALGRGATLYDLEGVDPLRNPGVYHFKRRMGGRVVQLAGTHFHPLTAAAETRVRGFLAMTAQNSGS
jgi:GNAT acetyltransferase-like protein